MLKRSVIEIVRDWYKGHDGLFLGGKKPYYVEYGDGQESVSMGWHTANNYASMFGGEVKRNPKYYDSDR